MKRKILWILGISIVALLLIVGMGRNFEIRNRQTDLYLQIAEEIYKVDTALKEVDEDYACKSISNVTPCTYADLQGNTIVYYYCQAAYLSNESGEYTGLNMDAVRMVTVISEIENKREWTVNE